MTPPMTDAELLAYIERTPELAALFPDAARWLSPHAAPYANVARAFHAHEQRVREEERALNGSTAPQLSAATLAPYANAELAAAQESLAFKSAQVDRILIEETANTKREKGKREAAEKALAAARAEADELARRVGVIASQDLLRMIGADPFVPDSEINEVIARVRAEMEKEKRNG